MARVMIVDDSLFLRSTLREVVSAAGHDVVGEAANGADAVALYQDVRPDLVLMDITMPEMNGIEALRMIRAFDHAACVIVCSAMGQRDMVIEAIRAGARDFVVKPFEPTRVNAALAGALG